jgi:acetyltransferase-like isoleucine patch superfamily enzyme
MGAIIGSSTNMRAGITIGDNVIVGYASNVVKDFIEKGIYVGNPAKKIADLTPELIVEYPKGWKPYNFSKKMLEKYLPYYRK